MSPGHTSFIYFVHYPKKPLYCLRICFRNMKTNFVLQTWVCKYHMRQNRKVTCKSWRNLDVLLYSLHGSLEQNTYVPYSMTKKYILLLILPAEYRFYLLPRWYQEWYYIIDTLISSVSSVSETQATVHYVSLSNRD